MTFSLFARIMSIIGTALIAIGATYALFSAVPDIEFLKIIIFVLSFGAITDCINLWDLKNRVKELENK